VAIEAEEPGHADGGVAVVADEAGDGLGLGDHALGVDGQVWASRPSACDLKRMPMKSSWKSKGAAIRHSPFSNMPMLLNMR
jgi:hypothetical protein